MATLVDAINAKRACHILTIEDPIEYLHVNDRAVVHQREVGIDAQSFERALRAALREDPDVVLVGPNLMARLIELELVNQRATFRRPPVDVQCNVTKFRTGRRIVGSPAPITTLVFDNEIGA